MKFRRGPLLFFPKVTMAAAAILDLLGAMGPPTKACSWCILSVKISSWSAKWFSSHKDLIFLSFSLESPIPQNFSFFGRLDPQTLRAHDSEPPKGTSLSRTTRFEPSLVQIWRSVRPVALAKKTKKERKTDSDKLAIRPDHPRRRICCSIHQVLLKSV